MGPHLLAVAAYERAALWQEQHAAPLARGLLQATSSAWYLTAACAWPLRCTGSKCKSSHEHALYDHTSASTLQVSKFLSVSAVAVIWATAASGASWGWPAGLAIALQSGRALLKAAGTQEAVGHWRDR